MSDERVINKFIEIARNQQEPMERRKRAIGWLSRSKDPKVLAFLAGAVEIGHRFTPISADKKSWLQKNRR